MFCNLRRSKGKNAKKIIKKIKIPKDALSVIKDQMELCYPGGLISKEVFVEMYRNYYKNDNIVEIANRIFEFFDFTETGNIDYLIVVIIIYLKTMKQNDRIELIFHILDGDDSGNLNYDEFKLAIRMQSIFKGQYIDLDKYEGDIRRLFVYFDASGDNNISFKEFKEALAKDPTIFDLN